MTWRSLGSRSRCHGQATIEYIVAASVLVSALFYFDVGGRTLAQQIADAVRAFFRMLTFYLSLP
jgi:hypothetical protein